MKTIYEPAGRAREYAPLALNVYRGCDHRCVYCYAPAATFTQPEAFGKPAGRPGLLDALQREVIVNPGNGRRVLLSFTCDPYQTLDVELCHTRRAIEILHTGGYSVQVLTKGGARALRDLDLFTPADAFATTLTLLDDACSLKWEPGAALPGDRIATLMRFHGAGIPTWVSLEPVLNPASALEIIRQTHEFVDLYKVGKLNHHRLAAVHDWQKFANDAVTLLESLGRPYYIKADLAGFLTAVSGPCRIKGVTS